VTYQPVKPPLTYFGGKTRIADRIAALMPAHEHYVEPFAGSLAVLLAKPPSPMETVNDLDGSLMTFWRVLRDRPADLERVCALTPHSRAEFASARRLNLAGDIDAGELETARRVWVQLTQGRMGRSSGWRHYQDARGSSASMPDYLAAYVGRIMPCAARLTNVSLEHKPALDIISMYGRHASTLIYADPPYPGLARWDSDRRYEFEMLSADEHKQFAAVVHDLPCAVMISGYDSPLYSELFGDWHRHEIPAFAGSGDGEQRARLEVVWSNREFPNQAERLF